MEDVSKLTGNVNEFAYIVVIKFKLFELEEVLDIPEITGNKVIHPDDVVTFGDKAVAEVGSEEPCCAGDQYTLFAHG